MIVALSPSCPIFSPAHEASLHNLLANVVRGRNILVAPPPAELESLLPSHVWALYGEVVQQRFKTATNLRRSWLHLDSCDTCDPDRLAMWADLPVLLLVENAHTDGKFIELAIRKCRPWLAGALAGVRPQVEIVQAGGVGEFKGGSEARRRAS